MVSMARLSVSAADCTVVVTFVVFAVAASSGFTVFSVVGCSFVTAVVFATIFSGAGFSVVGVVFATCFSAVGFSFTAGEVLTTCSVDGEVVFTTCFSAAGFSFAIVSVLTTCVVLAACCVVAGAAFTVCFSGAGCSFTTWVVFTTGCSVIDFSFAVVSVLTTVGVATVSVFTARLILIFFNPWYSLSSIIKNVCEKPLSFPLLFSLIAIS